MKMIRRHPVAAYVIASLLISYVVGIGAYLLLRHIQASLGTHVSNVNDIVMRFGPSLAGLLLAWLIDGWQGIKELIGRICRWRASAGLFALAICLPPLLTCTTIFLRGDAVDFLALPLWGTLSVFAGQLALAVVFGGLSEEIGWRGFMLPRLSTHRGPLVASILVAVAWLTWHVPAYFLTDKSASDPFLPFAAIMLPLSIVFTWISYRAQQSLLLPILLHGSINASSYSMEALLPRVADAAGFQPAFDWTAAVLWYGVALLLVIAYRQSFMNKTAWR